MSIHSRKQEHVELALSGRVTFREVTNGFERYGFEYNALPEIDWSDIDTRTTFCGVPLALPFLVTGMTGGYPDAEAINRDLAEAAAACGIALGVGSMRAVLESTDPDPSYTVLRSYAHRVPIIANIGAVQAAAWHHAGTLGAMIQRAVDLVGATALAIHCNPLQELLQPEGEPRFRGVLDAIAAAVDLRIVPIVVKEVGAGIAPSVAHRLASVGVTMIDVAGAGGTSWAGVEILRRTDAERVDHLWDVGIPTAECVVSCSPIVPIVIASGGIVTGTEAAKAIALGASLAGTARPALEARTHGGVDAIIEFFRTWELHLRHWMFLTGCASIDALRGTSTIRIMT
jgi:isopentenyl-diphosphate delta-isomerase